jgi:hypothetical protein
VADGVGIEVRMTLHCTSDVAQERSGVGQGWLDWAAARAHLLRRAHPNIIDDAISHGMLPSTVISVRRRTATAARHVWKADRTGGESELSVLSAALAFRLRPASAVRDP